MSVLFPIYETIMPKENYFGILGELTLACEALPPPVLTLPFDPLHEEEELGLDRGSF